LIFLGPGRDLLMKVWPGADTIMASLLFGGLPYRLRYMFCDPTGVIFATVAELNAC
jgi:hypothetical protein